MADILVEQEGPILRVSLNRPERLNAFSEEMLTGLTAALKSASTDPTVRVVVLSGEGRGFSAGGDVTRMTTGDPEMVADHIALLIDAVQAMVSLEQPIIAAVHGVAAGAGFNLALAADLVVASEQARFVMSFVHVGLISDGGGLWYLPRLVGPHRAKELFFLGEPISAQEAFNWGLVNRVVASEDFPQAVFGLAQTLARRPRRALAQTKRMVGQSFSMDLLDLMRQEQETQTVLAGTWEHREGVQAFLQKRAPNFSD